MAGKERFRGLDGLRGVAAIIVMLYHCHDYFHKGPIFMHGFLAVDAFMILSGFVISLTYEHQLLNGMTAQSFLYRRGRRLLPTYWMGAAIGIPLFWIATSMEHNSAYSPIVMWIGVPLATILLIPLSGKGTTAYPGTGNVAWSLFVEWFANIVYSVGIYRWSTRLVAGVAAAGFVIMTIVGYFSPKGWVVGIDAHTLVTLGVLRCLPSFLAGIVIFRIHRHSLFQRLPIFAPEVLLTCWIALAVIPTPSATPTIDAAIAIIGNPLVICLLIRSEHRASDIFLPLGAISYPLYVVHSPIIILGSLLPVIGMQQGPNPFGALVPITVALVFAYGVTKLVPKLDSLARRHALVGRFVPQ
jgi:peptidoglycan/LPS O-acetylase OafA/YrhL